MPFENRTWYILICLLVVNLLSFFWFKFVDLSEDPKEDNPVLLWISRLLPLLFGTFGAVVRLGLFDRRYEKKTWFWHVYTLCLLVIQVLVLLLFFDVGHLRTAGSPLTDGGIAGAAVYLKVVFSKYIPLWLYLAAVNVVTFALFALDKLRAMQDERRIRIATLLLLCAVGGSPGGWIGMRMFRHKTKTVYFSVGVPLILLTQLAVFVFLLYIGI